MFPLLKYVGWKSVYGSSDDDMIDMVNHKWTVALLTVFAVIVSSGQYVGTPIHCWCPAHFTSQYKKYTQNVCWVSNTYFTPMDSDLPVNISARQAAEISYYQWVPMILLLQAFLFKLPNIMWHLLNTQSGIDLNKLCKLVDDVLKADVNDRAKEIIFIGNYIHRWLLDSRHYHRNFAVKVKQCFSKFFLFCFGRREGQYLTGFYIFMKFLYFFNCIFQLYILNSFLSINYWLYGVEALNCLFGHCENVRESPRFPRVTMCDFEIRQMTNVQKYSVQCVLPINLFNEKIFTFLWFWIFTVGLCNVVSLLSWLAYLFIHRTRENFVRKYIWDQVLSSTDKRLCKKFSNEYLRNDGCFALRIVQINTTDIILADLMGDLWRKYKCIIGYTPNEVYDS